MRQTLYVRGEEIGQFPGTCLETELDCEVEEGVVTKLYGVGEISFVRADAPIGSCPTNIPEFGDFKHYLGLS